MGSGRAHAGQSSRGDKAGLPSCEGTWCLGDKRPLPLLLLPIIPNGQQFEMLLRVLLL